MLRLVLLLSVCSAAIGCGGGGPPEFTAPPVRVVCTTTIVADVVKHVGKERVAVETLMGPGVDPHRYLPTAGDREQLEGAHLVFFNGLHLEGKMTDTFEKSRRRFRAFAVTRDISERDLRPADTDGGAHDPHVWFDVKLWAKSIDPIRAELAKLDPGGAAFYMTNANDYRQELDKLDAEVRAAAGTLPKERRVLVTGHDAFGYFGRAYGFEVRGLQGVSTASEVGTTDRDRLAEFLGAQRVPAVFTETSVPDEGLKAVLDTTRQKYGHTVRLVGGDDALYSDALGAPTSPGGTYAGMVRHNIKVIVDALSK
ncbi:zinc ABC transporter substrate-binding protein [bacterium]|nr:zinc ABC transporter substrate-binding protein [bacterium]